MLGAPRVKMGFMAFYRGFPVLSSLSTQERAKKKPLFLGAVIIIYAKASRLSLLLPADILSA